MVAFVFVILQHLHFECLTWLLLSMRRLFYPVIKAFKIYLHLFFFLMYSIIALYQASRLFTSVVLWLVCKSDMVNSNQPINS